MTKAPQPAPAPAGDILAPGTEIFGYRIRGLLGKGGMGVVYHAEQLSLGRSVALKVLAAKVLRNPQAIEEFLREARAAGRLNHPHLVTVHDVFADPAKNLYAYSMEHVSGSTATTVVAQRLSIGAQALNRQEALHVAYQVAKALGHAHRNDLVHRDVKPDNVLLTRDLTAKLLDLGLVRDRLEGKPGTGSGNRRLRIVGTPDFSAPEQLRDPDEATSASDVYSLGATLFFLLAGRTPFDGTTLIDLIVNISTARPAYPANMPKDCIALCELLMAKDPEQRPEDGDAVVELLEGIARGERIPVPGAADAKPRSARPRRRVRLRR